MKSLSITIISIMFQGLKVLSQKILLATIFLFSFTGIYAQIVRSGSGTTAAAIQPSVDLFRADLGALNSNVAGSFGTGRREINWDGVPNTQAAPNMLATDFFNVLSPRGVIFSTPGTSLQVSANGSNPTGTPIDFGNIDALYPLIFSEFSAQRMLTAIGSNITDVSFVVPGSSDPALVKGFGAVFCDVDLSSSITLFDQNNTSLGTFDVPALLGNKTFSFLGISYASPVISRVRIIAGNTALAAGVTESAAIDLVVMDDFIYGEPVSVTVVPVKFTSLKAVKSLSGIQVQWTVETETNIREYILEKSSNGRDFNTGEITQALHQSSGYSWTDTQPYNYSNFYRVKAVNIDGAFDYSGIIRVNGTEKQGDISIYPNPVKGGNLFIRFTNYKKGNYTLTLYNASGQKIIQKVIAHQGGSSLESIPVSSDLKEGIYFLKVDKPGASIETFELQR